MYKNGGGGGCNICDSKSLGRHGVTSLSAGCPPGGGFILQEEVASRVLLVVYWDDDVSSRGRRGWSSLEDLPVTSDLFLEEVAGREDGLHIRRGNSKGMSEDISRGSRGGIILDAGDNGGLDYFLREGGWLCSVCFFTISFPWV